MGLEHEPHYYANFLAGAEIVIRRPRITVVHVDIAIVIPIHVRDVTVGIPRTRVLRNAIKGTECRVASCVNRSHRIVCYGSAPETYAPTRALRKQFIDIGQIIIPLSGTDCISLRKS